ncbi:hypothetical protein [Microtetraspora glauca]|uniref:Uncharacterized protein n=1 Tax=Microtetraspora glauca TaxID=1996 RepID=A0ABV3GSS8_MICGL
MRYGRPLQAVADGDERPETPHDGHAPSLVLRRRLSMGELS